MVPDHADLRRTLARLDDRELLRWTEDPDAYGLIPTELPEVGLPVWVLEPVFASRPLAVHVVRLPGGTLGVPSVDPRALHGLLDAAPRAFGSEAGAELLVAVTSPTLGSWELQDVVEPLRRASDGWHAELRVLDHAGRRLRVLLAPPSRLDVSEAEGFLL